MTTIIVDSVAILKECEDIFPDHTWSTVSLSNKVMWLAYPPSDEEYNITITYYFENSKLNLESGNTNIKELICHTYNIDSIEKYLISFKRLITNKDFSYALKEIMQVLKKYDITLKAYEECNEYGDYYSSINLIKDTKSFKVYSEGSDKSIFASNLNPKYNYFLG